MNEWHLTASEVISGLTAALVGVVVFYGRRHIAKLEELDAQAVRKRDLKELEERIEKMQESHHEENAGRLGRIENALDRTVERIDNYLGRRSP